MSSTGIASALMANRTSAPEVGGPWPRTFRLGEQEITVAVEADHWLVGEATIPGDEKACLKLQAEVHAPVRLIPGPRLRAEVPFRRDREEAFDLVRWALESGFPAFGAPGCETGPKIVGGDGLDLAAVLSESSRPWSEKDNTFAVRLDAGSLALKVSVCLDGESVVFSTRIASLPELDWPSTSALEHFLLQLQSRLRFARFHWKNDYLGLEIVLPVSRLDAWLVDKAAGALAAGAAAAKRECAALMQPDVARAYCDFHLNLHKEIKK